MTIQRWIALGLAGVALGVTIGVGVSLLWLRTYEALLDAQRFEAFTTTTETVTLEEIEGGPDEVEALMGGLQDAARN